MKNYLVFILLLFCFGAPFYGTCFFLQHQKHVVKKEIKRQIIAGIDKKELVHLKFSGSELHAELYWEHEKEFEYAGEMYDVVEKITIGDTTHFWCWPDHQETGLNQKLRKLVNDNFKNDPNRHARVMEVTFDANGKPVFEF